MVREYRSQMLERTLRTLHVAVPGVIATVVVNIDGLLVAAYPPGDEESGLDSPTGGPQVAAMSATLMGLAERTLRRLDQGDLERMLIEGADGVVVIYPAGLAALAVLVERNARMGRVLYAARRARNDIVAILGA